MIEDTNKPKKEPSEVWLEYRSKGSDVLHKLLVSGAVANRYARRLVRRKAYVYDVVADASRMKGLFRVRPSVSVDHLLISGTYNPAPSLKEAKIHLQVAQSLNYQRLKQQEVEEQESLDITAKRISKAGRITSHRMSFQIGRLDQSVILLCPVTGIIGKLEMPYCPVALNFEHPLSKPGNVLALLRYHFSLPGQQADLAYLRNESRLKLDRQTVAGCLLSLLKGKGLLAEEQESTAAERNMVLQNAGYDILSDVLKEIVRVWDNHIVWKRMPRLSVEWKAHSEASSTIGGSLQAWLKILKGILDPISPLTRDEQTKLFEATRTIKAKGVKVYSAQVVEHRKIKESKTAAYELFETLKPHLPIAYKLSLTRIIRDLLVLPQASKNKAASELRVLFVGKPQASVAKQLADVIEKASNEQIMSDLGTMSMEKGYSGSSWKPRTIAEILESKRKEKPESEGQ